MSLRLTYDVLRREVGRFLGFGRDYSQWSSDDTADVADIIASGLRSFYWPSLGDKRYTWSFLKHSAEITTASGTTAYDLPVDFSGSLLDFTYSGETGELRLAKADEYELRALHTFATLIGKPKYFAIRSKDGELSTETQYEAILWPVPDGTYTLSYRYAIEPPTLSDENIYPLGNVAHSECILEACLAAAEKTLTPESTSGYHQQRFAECLAASVKLDMEV